MERKTIADKCGFCKHKMDTEKKEMNYYLQNCIRRGEETDLEYTPKFVPEFMCPYLTIKK